MGHGDLLFNIEINGGSMNPLSPDKILRNLENGYFMTHQEQAEAAQYIRQLQQENLTLLGKREQEPVSALYSIKPHGDGYAIYRDRDLFHHGYNIGHLTEVTPETIKLIEDALNGELAKPEQEPVAVWELQEGGWDTIADADWMETLPFGTKLYTAPPRKEWVVLTDAEIEEAWGNTPMMLNARDGGARKVFAHAIEAKLKGKNGAL
jgi:hypothetical protein